MNVAELLEAASFLSAANKDRLIQAMSSRDVLNIVRETQNMSVSEIEFALTQLSPRHVSGVNRRTMNLSGRKSILYLDGHTHPRATATELAIIFGVSQQRVSQILGARGGSKTDADLLLLFRNSSPDELRDGWFCASDLDRLKQMREGAIRANPLTPRMMASFVNPLGRWEAYGYQFDVFERDQLFHFLIDGLSEGVWSKPRNSAGHARDDAISVARENAQFSVAPIEWGLKFGGENYEGPPKAGNARRIGDCGYIADDLAEEASDA